MTPKFISLTRLTSTYRGYDESRSMYVNVNHISYMYPVSATLTEIGCTAVGINGETFYFIETVDYIMSAINNENIKVKEV